ncbi:MAG: peptidase M23 [Rhodospirillaceae bacterium]|nr:peptidase M23 [Rhodospirillaceae bacterium]|tara:strand:+ start:3696 stop:5117 length:1422 start_codon:yes stop_codon:yes gene_type:complete
MNIFFKTSKKVIDFLVLQAQFFYDKKSKNWFLFSSTLITEKKRSSNFALGAIGGALIATIVIIIAEPFSLNARSRATSLIFENSKNNLSDLLVTMKPETLGKLSFKNEISYRTDLKETILKIKKGGNISQTLVSSGINRYDTQLAVNAISKLINPKNILAGQKIQISHRDNDLFQIIIPITKVKSIYATKLDEKQFFHYEDIKELNKINKSSFGIIESNLFLASKNSGVPTNITMEMIRIFSWDVDFQRDIKPNDKFEVIYECFYDTEGNFIKDGKILYAALKTNKKWNKLYFFPTKSKYPEYFNSKGESAKKALLKTPVDGARLSSRFGKRKHPILGYTRMHRGIDFAAPYGTPVMAAGNGTIEKASRNGGYGKYIRIRHKNNFKTAYAHLKSYARNIRPGKNVKQGQIIGYIGSTGVSTGPHLHYEVLRKGRQVNPLSLKLPTGRKLTGTEYKKFTKKIEEINSFEFVKKM